MMEKANRHSEFFIVSGKRAEFVISTSKTHAIPITEVLKKVYVKEFSLMGRAGRSKLLKLK